jgi:hypothetical protein
MIVSAFGRYLSQTAHDHEMPCLQGDRARSRGGCSRAAGDWPAGRLPLPSRDVRQSPRRLKTLRDHGRSDLSEQISIIKKDLVLHAVLNPSGSWPTRRRQATPWPKRHVGMVRSAGRQTWAPAPPGRKADPRRNADPIRKRTSSERGSCRLRGHRRLLRTTRQREVPRKGTENQDIT